MKQYVLTIKPKGGKQLTRICVGKPGYVEAWVPMLKQNGFNVSCTPKPVEPPARTNAERDRALAILRKCWK